MKKTIFAILSAAALWACNPAAVIPDTFTVSEENVVFPVEGGKITFEVSASSSWTGTVDNPYFTISPAYCTEAAKRTFVDVYAPENPGALAKQAVFTITTDDGLHSATVDIYQNPGIFLVTTGDPSAVLATSAILTGEFNEPASTPSECGIAYATAGSSDFTFCKDGTNTSPVSVQISGLLPETSYLYYAYAIVDGKTYKGEEKMFTTLKAISLQNFEVSYVAITTMDVKVNLFCDQAPSSYAVKMAPVTDGVAGEYQTVASTLDGDLLSAKITGLTSKATYSVYAEASAFGINVSTTPVEVVMGTKNALCGIPTPVNGTDAYSGTGAFKKFSGITKAYNEVYTSTSPADYADIQFTTSKANATTTAKYIDINGKEVESGYLCVIKFTLRGATDLSGGAYYAERAATMRIDGFDIVVSKDGETWETVHQATDLVMQTKYELTEKAEDSIVYAFNFDKTVEGVKYVAFALTKPRVYELPADDPVFAAWATKYLSSGPNAGKAAAVNGNPHYFRITELEFYRASDE